MSLMRAQESVDQDLKTKDTHGGDDGFCDEPHEAVHTPVTSGTEPYVNDSCKILRLRM